MAHLSSDQRPEAGRGLRGGLQTSQSRLPTRHPYSSAQSGQAHLRLTSRAMAEPLIHGRWLGESDCSICTSDSARQTCLSPSRPQMTRHREGV